MQSTEIIEAKIIRQTEQKNGFWLIAIETATALNPAIGSRFALVQSNNEHNNPHNQIWLLQANGKDLTLLSNQIWLQDNLSNSTEETDKFQLYFQQPNQANSSETTSANTLWLGEGLTQACIIDAAKRVSDNNQTNTQQLALIHGEKGFAFPVIPAKFMFDLLPEAIGASALLEDLKIPHRLATDEFVPGCHQGALADLYQAWLQKYASKSAETWTIKGFVSKKTLTTCQELSKNLPNINWQVEQIN